MEAHSSSSGARPDAPEPKETSKTGAAEEALHLALVTRGREELRRPSSAVDDERGKQLIGVDRGRVCGDRSASSR